jgi:hypothetical protein
MDVWLDNNDNSGHVLRQQVVGTNWLLGPDLTNSFVLVSEQ